MSLAIIFAAQFPAEVQRRGMDYFARGRVAISYADEYSVAADVQGSARYEVDLNLDEDVLDVFCSCSYFLDQGPCEHIWATLLVADRKGVLQPPPDSPTPSLVWAGTDEPELEFTPAPVRPR